MSRCLLALAHERIAERIEDLAMRVEQHLRELLVENLAPTTGSGAPNMEATG
jgi:hypothetical protein